MLQHDEQPIEIANRSRRIAAHDGGGLRGELRQRLSDLYDAHQVAGLGLPRFQRLRIEHLHAAGAGVEMHVVAAVMNRFLSLTVVQAEAARGRCQAAPHQRLRDTRHSVVVRNSDLNSRRTQELDHRRAHADSRVHQQCECFAQNAAD